MNRPKPRAHGRDGLWQDTAKKPYVPAKDLPDDIATHPLLRECPACRAAPRQRCTRPTRNGRRPLKRGYHPSRTTPPEKPQENPHD